jgi:chromosomal replication initiator protein
MSEPDARVWGQVFAHLRAHHPDNWRQWFTELEPLGVSGGILRIRAHSLLHRDYLHRQCTDCFAEAIQTVTGRLVAVRFVGPADAPDPVPIVEVPRARTRTAAKPASNGESGPATTTFATGPQALVSAELLAERRRRDALVINPDNSFENFIIGPGNRLAHAAAVAVAENPGSAYNPLFIHGGVGLGKTHLLQATCLKILEDQPLSVLYYTSCDSFMTQYFEAVQAGAMSEFQHKFRDVDVLIIDDIHFLAKREKSQEEFFHTFNSLYQAGKQLILSSDAAPEEIPHLEQRLVSRFKQGMVAQVQPPDFETRVAIVRRKTAIRGNEFPEDVAFHIATCIQTNIRELEGAITRIQMQAHVERRPVDLDVARAALGDTPVRASNKPTIHAVIAIVTEFFGVRITDLQSKRRPRSITLPRQVAMYLARQHTPHSLEEIGGHFGGRDHTTVMHAVRSIDERCKKDPEFHAQVAALDEKLRKTAP